MKTRVAEGEAADYGHLDMVSLAERMGRMLVLRGITALTVLVFSFIGPGLAPGRWSEIVAASIGYVLICLLFFGIGSIGGRRRLWSVAAVLLVDGVYLAWVVYLTGGAASPLRFLFHLHLVAVTLLASYRTGIKIALWYSLLLLVTFYAERAGVLVASTVYVGTPISLGFMIASLWFVAIGTSLFSSLNERELLRGRAELGMLADMAGQLETTHNPKEAAEAFLTAVMRAFMLERGVVLAVRGGETEVIAARGARTVMDQVSANGVLQRAWHEHKTVLLRKFDVATDPQLAGLLPESENLVIVPMFGEGEPLGALVLEYPKKLGRQIERRSVAMLNEFAAHASLALRNAWLLEDIETLAAVDPLTSVANRRTLQSVLESEIARAEREGGCLVFVMLDVDHFKAFNDTHGHQAGDDLLRNLAQGLKESGRAYDTVARYGGEEFAVVMPGRPSWDALSMAERLRRVASAADGAAAITVSAGVAVFPDHGDHLKSLIKAADDALYRSKRGGRNQTTLAASPRPVGV